jgi:hypothetical protein
MHAWLRDTNSTILYDGRLGQGISIIRKHKYFAQKMQRGLTGQIAGNVPSWFSFPHANMST